VVVTADGAVETVHAAVMQSASHVLY
jgi:hypothetical protein